MNSNLWEVSSQNRCEYKKLSGDIEVDILIVGGGFTGCSAALAAAQCGARVALVEARSIGHGGSGRNVGLVNAGLWLPPDTVEEVMGRAQGEALNATLAGAPDEVFDLIARHDIRCEAVRNGTLHLAHAPRGLKDLKTRFTQQQARQAPVSLLDANETANRLGTDTYCGALHDRRAGTVQPLAYVQGLAEAAARAGAKIYENSPLRSLEHRKGLWCAETPEGTVISPKCLLATNAYHQTFKGTTEAKTAKVSFFQLATDPLPDHVGQDILPGQEGCWDTALIMSSLRRDAAGRFILGAMGKPSGLGHGLHRSWAETTLKRLFPRLAGQAFAHFWAGEIAMTLDHVPKAIRFGPGGLYLMGFSGRGIAPGTRLGRLAAEGLLKDDESRLPLPILERYSERFSTLRTAYYESGARVIHAANRLIQ